MNLLNLCFIPGVAASVAFSVRLHEDTVLSDSPVVFGTVDLNIGSAYDEFAGFSPYFPKLTHIL